MKFTRAVKTSCLMASFLLATVSYAAVATAADKPATASATASKSSPAAPKAAAAADKKGERLNPEKAKKYNQAIKNAKASNANTQKQAEKLREQLIDIISADKFDKQAYIAKSNEIEKLNQQMRVSVAQAAADALTEFTAAERKHIAEMTANQSGGKSKGRPEAAARGAKASKSGGQAKGAKGGEARAKGADAPKAPKAK